MVLLSQFGRVVCYILEHAYCCQVVVDIFTVIASVLVDRVKDRYEIVLTQFVNVVIHDQL